MVDSSKGTSSTSVWDSLKSIGAFGILIVFLMAGVGIANMSYSSTITRLQIDNDKVQEELDIARAELAQVKSQSSSQGSATQNISNTSNSEKLTQEVSIGLESTERLFDGSLFISLITTSFEGSPLRHKVLATIGSPGYQNQEIDLKDVGYITTQGKDKV